MQIETLLDVRQAGGRLYARCLWDGREGLKSVRKTCRPEELDINTLIWTRGRRFPIAALSSRLRCHVCGCRHVSVSVSIPPAVNVSSQKVGT